VCKGKGREDRARRETRWMRWWWSWRWALSLMQPGVTKHFLWAKNSSVGSHGSSQPAWRSLLSNILRFCSQ
jgi:hypothetical protein